MDNSEKSTGNKPAGDKIHSMFGQEQASEQDLSYNAEKGSYELDRKSENPDYDHPLPYDTAAANGEDDNSSYDEANPYVGDEYANKDSQVESGLNDMGMRVDDGSIVKLSTEDELLARTPEDDRDDLDEEGYPLNDA